MITIPESCPYYTATIRYTAYGVVKLRVKVPYDLHVSWDGCKSWDIFTCIWVSFLQFQKYSYVLSIGRAHCDVLLNNLCEVFNRQLLDGRDVPIITCLEFVREYLMKRIVNVKNMILKSKGPLTPAATLLFDAVKNEVSFYTVNSD
ncbi:hypothetical protein Tco_1460978 [Tanacetum coccineum]